MFSCMLQQIDKALNPKKENLKEIEKKKMTNITDSNIYHDEKN